MPNQHIEALERAVGKSEQLCSIFDRITSDGSPPPKKRNGVEARVLQEHNIVPPADGLTSSQPISRASMEGDLSRFSSVHQAAQDDTAFYLLQKYGWRIGQPDIEEDKPQDEAFCDHYRVGQALKKKGDNGGYLLVKGDLSGIQEYIYGNIQQKTAGGLAKLSKRLRGRSIMVTLLTDFLANVALRELGLPVWNLLFAGGGHFNLLLPDTPDMRQNLSDLDKKLDGEMRRVFGNRLHLVLASVACSEADITQKAGLCFERLNAEREAKKHQQHLQSLSTRFYPSTGASKHIDLDDLETKIGQVFPKMHYLIEAVCDGPIFKTGVLSELVKLEMKQHTYSLLVVEEESDAIQLLSNATGLVSAQAFALNHTDFLPQAGVWDKVTQPISFGFRFLGRYVPTIDALNVKSGQMENRPQTFEEIAKTDALEMLGAIRLDVDDLGFIFSHGMQGASLAQIVTLSREMHYFFSAHFDQLAEEHQLYLIYSGGDDAFAVGQWDKLIQFTQRLQTDFQRFTFRNKATHFSAGIFLGDPKYPVGRFYLDAGTLLEEAKKSNDDKSRVHIFHNIIGWEAFEKKIKFGEGLAKMLDKKDGSGGRKLTMAFAYRLLSLVKSSFYERADIVNGVKVKRGYLNHRRFAQNISRMRYLFARHGYNHEKSAEVASEVEKQLIGDFLRNFKFGGPSTEQTLRDNVVALNYALYTIRSQKNAEQ
jgi:CRISPR-associated protein Csm1